MSKVLVVIPIRTACSAPFIIRWKPNFSLGAGDVIPVGEIRLIASAASLNGILLLAWSGAFLFAVTEGGRRADGQE